MVSLKSNIIPHLIIILSVFSCADEEALNDNDITAPELIIKTIHYNNQSVDVVIDMPEGDEYDVLMVFRGTIRNDRLAVERAKEVIQRFKSLLDKKDMLIISVAYREENLLFGDNIIDAETALLWTKHQAAEELGININKIFLAGHSQGGYLVTRLNTMHPTDGVIANAPGPLNLLFRCGLEEDEKVANEIECQLLNATYGSTAENPEAYIERSLLNFTEGFLADILFVQGLIDSPIHMHSWPRFKEEVENCRNCKDVQVLELNGFGHAALFQSQEAKETFNRFLNR